MAINEKTRLLINIGAAMAANCIPCFEYYYGKAVAAGIDPAEITEALEAAAGVKNGAHLALKNRIGDIMKGSTQSETPCGKPGASNCCG